MNYSSHAFNCCSNCPVHERGVCSRSSLSDLATLEKEKHYRSFAAGETVVWCGDHMDFVATVVKGCATLGRMMDDGRSQIVGLLQPSDFLGHPFRSVAPHSVTACCDLLLCCFRREAFARLAVNMPHIYQRLYEMKLDERDAARNWLLVLGRKTAREKVASLFVVFARRDETDKHVLYKRDASFYLPLTREQMADYLGLSIETVSRQISALQSDKVIRLEGARKVIVPIFEDLKNETGEITDNNLLV